MDYSKYSKQAFESLTPDSPEMMLRLKDLNKDVNFELHAAVLERFKEIVSSLNSVGHSLAESPQSKAGEIDFTQFDPIERHVFYLCCDTVISSGYRGTTEHFRSNELSLESPPN
jgi:hypothetical protein